MDRKWLCVEIVESYLHGAMGRFEDVSDTAKLKSPKMNADGYYRIPHPGLLWNEHTDDEEQLPEDVGRQRSTTTDQR